MAPSLTAPRALLRHQLPCRVLPCRVPHRRCLPRCLPSALQSWFTVEADGWGGQMEASLSVGDWITNVAYFSVVSICAPIWEEVRLCARPRCRPCDAA